MSEQLSTAEQEPLTPEQLDKLRYLGKHYLGIIGREDLAGTHGGFLEHCYKHALPILREFEETTDPAKKAALQEIIDREIIAHLPPQQETA